MNLNLSDDLFDKQNILYLKLRANIKKFLLKYLKNDDKNNINMGYVTVMVLLRIASNVATKIGIGNESFIFAADNMYQFELMNDNDKKNKTEIENKMLN